MLALNSYMKKARIIAMTETGVDDNYQVLLVP